MNAIRVEGVTRRFGTLTAVDDVSFEVSAGEVVALLGPNGAGKTTLLEMLEGFDAPTCGHITVLGRDPQHADRRWRSRIGLVLQSTSLDPMLRVRDAIGVFGGVFPNPRSTSEVLEMVDLPDEATTRIGQLSGGQQRRVDLALGIVGRPEVLFLDEPTTGLDPAARRRTWGVIEQLADDGTTVLLSTHYMEEAQQLAGRLLVLREGELLADTDPDSLRASALRVVVRLPLPPHAPLSDLPPELALGLDDGRRTLRVVTNNVACTLQQLVDWASTHDVALDALEVGAPSLEDAYLALTAAGTDASPLHV